MKQLSFTIIFFIFSIQLYAEIIVSPSIEWITCESDLVLMVKIEKINFAEPSQKVTYDNITFEIDEVLKGALNRKTIQLKIRSNYAKPINDDLADSANKFLIFLKKSDEENKYIPSSSQFPLSIININKLPDFLYNKDGERLNDFDSISSIVKEWSNSKISYSIDIESKQKEIRSFATFVVVPAEEKYKEIFLNMMHSLSPNERKKASFELYKFPSLETEIALREILSDETEVKHFYAADEISKIEFSIRVAAINSLKKLGKSVPELETERQPTKEESRLLRQTYWQKTFEDAPPREWNITNIEDGVSFKIENRHTTSVIITCTNGEAEIKIILIPKEWKTIYHPNTKYLGGNLNSQGGRLFFVVGKISKSLEYKLINYFGLKELDRQ